jgi:type IV secretion system protein TrbI
MSAERFSPIEVNAGGRSGAPRRNLAPLYAGGLIVLILLVFAMNFGGAPKPKPQTPPPPAAGSANDLSGLLEEEAARKQRSATSAVSATQPRSVPASPAPALRSRPDELGFAPTSPLPESALAPAGTYNPRWPEYLAQQGRPPLPLPPSAPIQLGSLEGVDRAPSTGGAGENRPALRYRSGSPTPSANLPADPAGAALAALAAELPALSQSSQPQPADPALGHGADTPSSRYTTFLEAVGKDRSDTLELGRDPANARTPFLLLQGTQIPAVLETGINSELPGQASGYVRKDIYDSLTGRYLLIPQGSRLLGSYNSDVVWGASRLLLVWNRLILPDGTSYSIVAPSADLSGTAGLSGRVNNHWVKTLGSALMLSAISAGIQISQNPATTTLGQAPSASQAAGAAVGQEVGQVSSNIIRKNLDIPPTLSLPPGFAFSVVLTRDVALPHPYLRRLP